MTSTNPRYYSSTLAQPALSGRRVTVVGIIIGLILMLVAARGASLQILEAELSTDWRPRVLGAHAVR